jgi:hypothetical protein
MIYMKPIPFKEANLVLTAPPEANGAVNAGCVSKIEPLHVFTNNEACISCWQPTWRERLSILFKGRVWLMVLSGRTQPPVALLSDTPFQPAVVPPAETK